MKNDRLIGASVLLILAVIFIPLLLENEDETIVIDTTDFPVQEAGFDADIIPPDETPTPSAASQSDDTRQSLSGSIAGGGDTGLDQNANARIAPGLFNSSPASAADDPLKNLQALPSGPADQAPQPAATTLKPDQPLQADGAPDLTSGPATDQAAAADTPPFQEHSATPDPVTGWIVQLASFESEENALALREELRNMGYAAVIERTTRPDGKPLMRVYLQPEVERSRAEALRDRLEKELKLEGLVKHYVS